MEFDNRGNESRKAKTLLAHLCCLLPTQLTAVQILMIYINVGFSECRGSIGPASLDVCFGAGKGLEDIETVTLELL